MLTPWFGILSTENHVMIYLCFLIHPSCGTLSLRGSLAYFFISHYPYLLKPPLTHATYSAWWWFQGADYSTFCALRIIEAFENIRRIFLQAVYKMPSLNNVYINNCIFAEYHSYSEHPCFIWNLSLPSSHLFKDVTSASLRFPFYKLILPSRL